VLTSLLGSLAESLRDARIRSGHTLDQLAELAGLSKAYLSRLESAERQPSLATLLTLSRVLGAPMSVLLGENLEGTPLSTYGDDQPAHTVNGLTITTCSGFPGSRALEAVRIGIDPDRTPPPFARHRGEEWVYVLSGVLRFEYDDGVQILEAGKSAHFDADRPHRLGAHGTFTEVLLVAAEVPTDPRRRHQ
jgi:transcriptional regulator with XRE-family HTH domain